MQRVRIPTGLARQIRRGRVWVRRRDIGKRVPSGLTAGEVVILEEEGRREFVGLAMYSPHSQIPFRVLTTHQTDLTMEFFHERLERAWQRRQKWMKAWPETDAFRWVHGESDGLPGLVIDYYNGHAIVQIFSFGMERYQDFIWAALEEFSLRGVAEKSTGRARRQERLAERVRVIRGTVPDAIVAQELGEPILVPWLDGQKSGVYLDQKESRAWLRFHAEGQRVLDLCCYKADFARIAARHGAAQVVAVDSSLRMLEWAEKELEQAGLAERVELVHADVFDYLRHLVQQKEEFDLIILDPPPLARSAKHLRAALRGYRELNRQALKLLAPGGYLLSCSCSHRVTQADFIGVIRQAAASLPRAIQLIGYRKAPADHPVLPNQLETDYFQCMLIQTMA